MTVDGLDAVVRGLLQDARVVAALLDMSQGAAVYASDAAGVVTVGVSPLGTAMEVRLRADWRSCLDDGALGGRVVEAAGAAQRRRQGSVGAGVPGARHVDATRL